MRDAIVRCRSCGCWEQEEMMSQAQWPARTAQLIAGIGALHRDGGCLLECPCHADFRIARDSPFVVTASTAREGLTLPKRP